MKEVSVFTINIKGKDYFLVDTIPNEKNRYYYFSTENNPLDIQVFKKEIINGEDHYISVDDDLEFDDALELFYKKYNEGNEML